VNKKIHSLKTNPPSGKHVRGRMLFCFAGWGLAAMLCLIISPRVYHRLIIRFPSVQQDEWNQVMASRKAALAAAPWKDSRPLHVFAGDSHIEMGNWYELFGGACAVRNCGLSRATIQDVTTLVEAVPDHNPETVVLMCGINNLTRNDPVEHCIAEYEQLLAAAHALNARKVVVLSVMPVRQSPVDLKNRKVDQEVLLAFNERLKTLCDGHNAVFVNVNGAVMNGSGGLASELTDDGLHLNSRGYRKIADLIRSHLTNETTGQK
jgi:lysophospholipase L1-like esterase